MRNLHSESGDGTGHVHLEIGEGVTRLIVAMNACKQTAWQAVCCVYYFLGKDREDSGLAVACRQGRRKLVGLVYYLGGELFVEQSCVHGKEGVVTAVFDGTFSMAVDKYGALLGLGIGYAADVDECFDYIVEGVDIVIVQNQIAAGIFEDGGFVVR